MKTLLETVLTCECTKSMYYNLYTKKYECRYCGAKRDAMLQIEYDKGDKIENK